MTIRIAWLIPLLLSTITAVLAIEYFLPPPKSGPALQATETLKLAVESFTSLRQLLISWSFGVIAAIAFFLKSNLESHLELERRVFYTLIISSVLVIASLFSGHLVLDRLALYIARDLNPFKDKTIYVLGLIQYVLLLLSMVAVVYAMALIYLPRVSDSSDTNQADS